MKKVIFICLLSLSVCLSQAADNPAATPPVSIAPSGDATNQTQKIVPPPPVSPNTTVPQTPTNETQTPTAPETKTNETKPDTTENKTDKKDTTPPQAADGNKVDPPKDAKNATDDKGKADNKANNTTTPDSNGDKKNATTQIPEISTVKPTEASKTDGEKPTLQARGFDGPSFIGGIILTLGLLAIGFMGFKYYKNQTERNYHTL